MLFMPGGGGREMEWAEEVNVIFSCVPPDFEMAEM